MKGRTLAVIVVVSLAVVSWAVYALVGGSEPEVRKDKRTPVAAKHDEAPRDGSSSAKKAAPEPASPSNEGAEDHEPARRRPPEPAKPNMTIEEAREKYDDYIAELDREIAKSEETERDLANEAWVDYYRRGHEVMDPLRRLLDVKKPEHQREVSEKYELVRKKLQQLEPRPKPTG